MPDQAARAGFQLDARYGFTRIARRIPGDPRGCLVWGVPTNMMTRRISLDTIPIGQVGMASERPTGRDAWNGTATQWRGPAWVILCADDDRAALRYLIDHDFDARLYTVQTYSPALGKRPSGWRIEAAFPGYLLLRLAPNDPRHLLRRDSRNGIDRILSAVGQPDSPAILPDPAMLVLLGLVQQNAWAGLGNVLGRVDRKGFLAPIPKPAEMYPDLTGELLEIEDHPFLSGLRGQCVASSKARLSLLTEAMGMVTVARDKVRVV